MPTPAELLASINELPADERAAFASAFQNDGGPGVTAARSKAFADGKKEGAKGAPDVARELATAKERIVELEGEVEALNQKAPDYAEKERLLKEKHAKALAEKDVEIATAKGVTKTALEKVALGKLRALVTAQQDDGTRVDPSDADDEYIARYARHVPVADDGTQDVLKLGGDGAYDAADADAKLGLLASDIRKQIATTKPKWILSNADTGGGVTNGGGFGGGHSYDPVAAGRAEGKREREANTAQAENNLAFR